MPSEKVEEDWIIVETEESRPLNPEDQAAWDSVGAWNTVGSVPTTTSISSKIADKEGGDEFTTV